MIDASWIFYDYTYECSLEHQKRLFSKEFNCVIKTPRIDISCRIKNIDELVNFEQKDCVKVWCRLILQN